MDYGRYLSEYLRSNQVSTSKMSRSTEVWKKAERTEEQNNQKKNEKKKENHHEDKVQEIKRTKKNVTGRIEDWTRFERVTVRTAAERSTPELPVQFPVVSMCRTKSSYG